MDDREHEVTEVRETRAVDGDTNVRRQSVSTAAAAPGSVVVRRIVWFIAGVVIALLAIRMVLLLLAANQGNAFVDFIYNLSAVFAAPFYGIFSYQPTYGSSTFEVSSLVAIIIYALIAWGLAKLLTLNRPSTDTEV